MNHLWTCRILKTNLKQYFPTHLGNLQTSRHIFANKKILFELKSYFIFLSICRCFISRGIQLLSQCYFEVYRRQKKGKERKVGKKHWLAINFSPKTHAHEKCFPLPAKANIKKIYIYVFVCRFQYFIIHCFCQKFSLSLPTRKFLLAYFMNKQFSCVHTFWRSWKIYPESDWLTPF